MERILCTIAQPIIERVQRIILNLVAVASKNISYFADIEASSLQNKFALRVFQYSYRLPRLRYFFAGFPELPCDNLAVAEYASQDFRWGASRFDRTGLADMARIPARKS